MAANLELRLTGGAANNDPDASLGGDSSSAAVSATPQNSILDDVVPNEAWTGDTEYRALSLHNKGDEEAESIELYISSETDSPDSIIAIGKDSGTQSIADEDTAPTSPAITFSHPLSDSKMSISNLAAGAAQRLWFRRTIKELAAYHANDLFSLKADYDTIVPPPWVSKFGLSYWTCSVNCFWDGDSYNVAGAGLHIVTVGAWAVGYRPTKIRITATHNAAAGWNLHTTGPTAAIVIPVGAHQTGEASLSWGTDITGITDDTAPGVGEIEDIEFLE